MGCSIRQQARVRTAMFSSFFARCKLNRTNIKHTMAVLSPVRSFLRDWCKIFDNPYLEWRSDDREHNITYILTKRGKVLTIITSAYKYATFDPAYVDWSRVTSLTLSTYAYDFLKAKISADQLSTVGFFDRVGLRILQQLPCLRSPCYCDVHQGIPSCWKFRWDHIDYRRTKVLLWRRCTMYPADIVSYVSGFLTRLWIPPRVD